MRIGLALPHYEPSTLDRVVAIAVEAERLGFDSVWVSDHLVFDLAKYGGSPEPIGCLEPMSTLGVLAAETSRVHLGTMVLCEAFRPPALLAKQAATLQLASSGRFELGLGAGWYEPDYAMLGMAMPPAGVRLRRLEEAVRVIKLLFSGEEISFDGTYHSLDGAVARPAPVPPPPVWVGGKGDRAVALAGRVGDGWNAAWFSDPDAYAERARHLGAAMPRRSIGQYAEGSAAEQVDRLAAFAALGVELAVLCFGKVPFALDDPDDVARFAQDVLPEASRL